MIRETNQILRVEFHCAPPHMPNVILEAVNQHINSRGDVLRMLERNLVDGVGEVVVVVQVSLQMSTIAQLSTNNRPPAANSKDDVDLHWTPGPGNDGKAVAR